MEIGDAYKWMKPRLEAVSARSQDPSFKAGAAEAIDTFETVKAMDGRPSSCFGLIPGDEADHQDVQVSGVARLWDLGDRLHFRLEKPGTLGMGNMSTSYDCDQQAGNVYVEKHRNVESWLSVLVGPPEMQQSVTLDLVEGKTIHQGPWVESPIPPS